MVAAYATQLDITELLLTKHAVAVNARDHVRAIFHVQTSATSPSPQSGRTALHYAAEKGATSVVAALLSAGGKACTQDAVSLHS